MRKWCPAVLGLMVLASASLLQGESSPPIAAAPKAGPPPAAAGPAPAARAATPAETLRTELDRLFADPQIAKMAVGVRIVTLGAPGAPAEVLYSARADQPLVPASTMKLLTTGACLDRLGPDWRIKTHVGHIPAAGPDAKFDLAVIGGGDPNFSGRFYKDDTVGAFRQWAVVLKERGVTSVGRVVLDDTLFDDVLQHPNWPPDQRAEWYEAPVSALNLNDNCVDIHVSPGKAGAPALVVLEPPGGYAAIEGTILTVADRKDHGFSIERVASASAGGAIRLRVAGRYWAQSPETVENRTVVSPTMFFGSALAETLRAEGINVAGPIVRERLADAAGRARADFVCDVLHQTRLDATVAVANKRSQGLYAECMMKLLGAFGPTPKIDTVLPPRQGSWQNGADEVRRWMVERGIPAEGCVIDDGSGLSKTNRLTALAVTELLRVMYERHGDLFVQTLAEPGEGSLIKRLRNTPADGRVFGKTGYVLGASALSGYVRAKSGRILIYSIIMNDVPWGGLWKARDAQDKVCLRLVEM